MLDLSGNFFLECKQPLNQLQAFSRLRWAARGGARISHQQGSQARAWAASCLHRPQAVCRRGRCRWLDLRAVHIEAETTKYWSPAKW